MTGEDLRNLRSTDFRAVLGLFGISGLYLSSFFMTVHDFPSGKPLRGWDAFYLATLSLCESPPLSAYHLTRWLVGWLPNPALWVGIVLLALGRWRIAALAGFLGLVGALSWGAGFPLLGANFSEFREGYYCWLSSMAALAGFGLWLTWRSPRPRMDLNLEGSPGAFQVPREEHVTSAEHLYRVTGARERH